MDKKDFSRVMNLLDEAEGIATKKTNGAVGASIAHEITACEGNVDNDFNDNI